MQYVSHSAIVQCPFCAQGCLLIIANTFWLVPHVDLNIEITSKRSGAECNNHHPLRKLFNKPSKLFKLS